MPFGAASGEEDVHNVTEGKWLSAKQRASRLAVERKYGILVFAASTDTAPIEIAYGCSSGTVEMHFFAWKQQNQWRRRQTEYVLVLASNWTTHPITGLIPLHKMPWMRNRANYLLSICLQFQVVVVFTHILRSHFILCRVKHQHGSHHKKLYKSLNQVRGTSISRYN